MTLFDKVLINLHKGFEKLKQGAAVFSERVRFELNIVRMRIRINDIRERITELHARIGRAAAELSGAGKMPATFEAFLKGEETAAALEEIAKLKKEIEEVTAELAREQEEVVAAAKGTGENKA